MGNRPRPLPKKPPAEERRKGRRKGRRAAVPVNPGGPRTQGRGVLGEPSAPPAACPAPRRLTFDGDDMLADLVLQHRLLHPLQQLVDGVDVGVHGLEALDLGPDGCRVGQLLLVVHGAAAPVRRPLRPGAFSLRLARTEPPAQAGGRRRREAGRRGDEPRSLPPPHSPDPPPPAPGRAGCNPSPRSPQGAPPRFVRSLSLHRAGGAGQAGRPRPHGGRHRGGRR